MLDHWNAWSLEKKKKALHTGSNKEISTNTTKTKLPTPDSKWIKKSIFSSYLAPTISVSIIKHFLLSTQHHLKRSTRHSFLEPHNSSLFLVCSQIKEWQRTASKWFRRVFLQDLHSCCSRHCSGSNPNLTQLPSKSFPCKGKCQILSSPFPAFGKGRRKGCMNPW